MIPEIILGPPGTGKTTTLLRMVEEELERGTPPDRIGYFSFTKKAASEASKRASEKFSLDRKQLPYFRTLHSLCFQTIGMSNSDVFEGKKLLEFGDWIGLRLTENHSMDDTTMFGFSEGDRALFMENLARVKCVDLRHLFNQNCDGLPWQLVERVQRGLLEFKRARNLHDYTDMLQIFVDANWAPPLEVVFVDESQDLSMLQWRVVERLTRNARRLVVAGDDDQAIYRWAGAAVEHFVQLRGDARVLGQSWRVPPEIQSVSQEVISRVRNRRPKAWAPTSRAGAVERRSTVLDTDLSGEDILILGRNIFTLRIVAADLRREGLLYDLRGNNSIPPAIMSAVRLWERLRRGEEVKADDARIVYGQMSSGRGFKRGYKSLPGVNSEQMVSLDWLQRHGGLQTTAEWYTALDRISRDDANYLRAALQNGERPSSPRIRLSTVHGSKGGEAEHVILLPDMARRTHQEMLEQPEDEARVWYVAVTRAKSRLTLTKPKDRLHYVL